MNCRCGIVGLPNVGKSTFFNALTKAKVAAENYPFCTIDPNVGVVSVPDRRLDTLAQLVPTQKLVPATVEFVDIAGLVKGAAQGEGLGNRFLAHIREATAIAQVVRCFDDDNVVHVAGKVDPLSDIEVINTELMLADLEVVERARARLVSPIKSGNLEAIQQDKLLAGVQALLAAGQPIRSDASYAQEAALAPFNLLTQKPTLYIANVAVDQLNHNVYLQQVEQYAQQQGCVVVPLCATWESELLDLPEEERTIFLQELGWHESGLDRVISQVYRLLNLQTFFTVGPQEIKAWTILKGSRAPTAAGVIHSDFERGFICAEVISFADFVRHKGEHGAREAGKLRLEGKEYYMQDGDIVHFRFNV